MGVKLAVVAALSPPAIAVLLFEVILNATALFNHANISLPSGVDRVLRLLVVTPDMHCVHHSIDPRETNSNYGSNLPWWDRLLTPISRNSPGVMRGWSSGSSSSARPETNCLTAC
ncbi:MAG: sterol desaturase family protein [Cypionkella sp.]